MTTQIYTLNAIMGLILFLVVLKHVLFIGTLIYIAIHDHKTHEIYLLSLVPIVVAGFLCLDNFFIALAGAAIVSIPMYIVLRMNKGGIGMGDVLLMAAVGFVLGPQRVVFATICGLTLFLLYYVIFKRKRNTAYAMAPWLSAGAILVYLF